eukprot:TRINITY_DN2567_c0_g1_i2.p1 TRINITY_DN2567_c0_g1~~TRINITY_DN2567_c0_g1_i2.p1  ORF type:complete len:703 (+),score=170.60 TRINITY_DN2567_c0_g1_i2:86-2194(+)
MKNRLFGLLLLCVCVFGLTVDCAAKSESLAFKEKVAKEVANEAKRLGQDLSILKVYEVKRCLDDEDILSSGHISSEQLDRIRKNTDEILGGKFLENAQGQLGLNFYESYVVQESNKNASDSKRPFPKRIRVETNPWESHNLASMLMALLLQDVLNYPVDFWLVEFGAVQTPWDRAALGWTHFNVEQWLSDDIGGYAEFVIEKQEVTARVAGYGARIGLYMPTYMVEKQSNKKLIMNHWKSLSDPRVYKQFPKFDPKRYDAIYSSKRERQELLESFSCIRTYCKGGYFIPKQCRKNPTQCRELLAVIPDYATGIIEQLVTNLKLPFVVVYLGQDPMLQEVGRRMDKKEPALFFNWVPSLFESQRDITRVYFPDPTPECYANRTYDPFGKIDCDFQFEFLQMLVWKQLSSYAPSAVALYDNYQLSSLDMAVLLNDYSELLKIKDYDEEGRLHDPVCSWLKANPEVWNLWIPIPVEDQELQFSSWVQALIVAVAAISIGFYLLLIGLVFYFRKRTIVKFSEPVFLYIMIIGAILASVGVLLNVVPLPLQTFSCQITIWFICCGFTLFFGSLLLKTFRLVWIFFHIEKVKPQNFLFSKLHLALLIMALLAIDAVILGVWTGTDTLESSKVADSNSEIEFWMLCRSDHDVAFIITLAVYKCVLVGLGALMAFLSRHLPNVLNEAYYIGLSVYNVGLFIGIIFPVAAV